MSLLYLGKLGSYAVKAGSLLKSAVASNPILRLGVGAGAGAAAVGAGVGAGAYAAGTGIGAGTEATAKGTEKAAESIKKGGMIAVLILVAMVSILTTAFYLLSKKTKVKA